MNAEERLIVDVSVFIQAAFLSVCMTVTHNSTTLRLFFFYINLFLKIMFIVFL